MTIRHRIILLSIFLSSVLFSTPAQAVLFQYSNPGYTYGQQIDSANFGGTGSFTIYEHEYSFNINEGETSLGFVAFIGGIQQPSSGSGSGTFVLSGPMTINGKTQNFSFNVDYTFQKTPTFTPSTFLFTNLPSLQFDFGSDGVLVGTWLNDTVTCGATQSCGGGTFPGVEFTLYAAPVPEPATMLLLGAGLAGLFAGRRMLKR